MGRVDPATVADRIEIMDLMTKYGMAIDRCDDALFKTVFAPDAHIDYSDSGFVVGERDEVAKSLWEALGNFVGLHHNMTNHLCEIDGDTARAVTYFLAFHAALDGNGGEVVMTMSGHYQDRLRRTDDGWRIVQRVERGVWMEGPYPADMAPKWYGTADHNLPSLPD